MSRYGQPLTAISVALALTGVLSGFAPTSHFSRAENVGLIETGLRIWRKPGHVQNGAACATCHSPDGIELAAYRFDDEDILRRARPHLDGSDCQILVEYIHALRSKFGFQRLRDPNLDRPLQPGGEVLPGLTPSERDMAFGLELQKRLPLLFRRRIEDVSEAKAAEKELLRLSPVNLKIGIPFNRLSEDLAHGNEHSSIAQWLPEEGPPIPEGQKLTWYEMEDEYLRRPSAETLHRLLTFYDRNVDTSRAPGLGVLSASKFRALLVFQDRVRRGIESRESNLTDDVQGYGNFNPIWNVGDVARQNMDRDAQTLGMSSEIQSKKTEGPKLESQLHSIRAAWFWAGWLSDQGLFKTSLDDKTRLGLWFSESLSKDGPYPFHDVYANSRRQAVISNDPASWGETPARRRRIWDFAGLRSFRRYLSDMPKDPLDRKQYVKFTANCFRMNLLLLEDTIRQTHEIWLRRNSAAIVGELTDFIVSQDPEDFAHAKQVQTDLLELISNATERN